MIDQDNKLSARQGAASRAALLLLAFLLAGIPLAADPDRVPVSEYQLKAAFLIKFAHFIDWPTGESTDPEAPLIIGVLGPDPFQESLAAICRDAHYHGRHYRVVYFENPEDLGPCHILFINSGDPERVRKINQKAGEYPAVTVSDYPGFLNDGGLIMFVVEDGKVRFDINQARAGETGIQFHSRLLRLARKVRR